MKQWSKIKLGGINNGMAYIAPPVFKTHILSGPCIVYFTRAPKCLENYAILNASVTNKEGTQPCNVTTIVIEANEHIIISKTISIFLVFNNVTKTHNAIKTCIRLASW
jgi:hypothetical protein